MGCVRRASFSRPIHRVQAVTTAAPLVRAGYWLPAVSLRRLSPGSFNPCRLHFPPARAESMTTPPISLLFGRSGTDADPRSGLFQRLRTVPSRLGKRIQRVSTERWWLLLFLALFLGFFVALLFQPGIGRGGR